MRMIILKEISLEEIKCRKKYIELISNMFFIPYRIADGVEFISIPSNNIDYLLLIGHNINVEKYLNNNKIIEKNIVIISCKLNLDKKIKQKKYIYVSYNKQTGKTDYFDGHEWRLNFDITKEELKLINSYQAFDERINNVFRRIT